MAKVYVGTYGKYNAGSLAGAWLDLNTFENYAAFVAKCREVHKDEEDPEFMIQDTEDFPDGLSCMEWISEEEFNDVRAAEKEDAPAVQIVDYSEKAFAVVGDTKPIKDQLKKLGGRFNGKLSCGAGWIFSNKCRAAVESFISGGVVAEVKTDAGTQFVEWLKEYADTRNDKEYMLKHYAGAIKIDGHYMLLDKPHIQNKFCFHDEGPDYEYYCSLSNEKKLERHFLNANLSQFDELIEHIEKGDEYTHDTRLWIRKHDNGQLCYSCDPYRWNEADKYTLCTDEERNLILAGYKFARSLFEKRLDAYLKRYGTSKIHTWSYWADA